MYAAVDLGSNSFRLHVGVHDGNNIRVVKSARDPVRLAAGLDASGKLTPQAIQSALDSLSGFRAILADYPLSAVRVVATNTLRIATNAATFLPAAEAAIGYPIEIISGEEEGRLIYMGVASQLPNQHERRLVIDIGGGSTELIMGRAQEIESVESFSIGTFRQSRDFFIDGRIDPASFDAAVLAARSCFEDAALYRPLPQDRVYGSSGTMRAISDAIAKNGLGDGRMSRISMEALRARLIEFGHTSRIVLTGMKPDRSSVIVGGLSVLMGAMQELGIQELVPIEAGLRMGVLWDLQLRATLRDRRDDSVRQCQLRFHADAKRGANVAAITKLLFAQQKPAAETLVRYLGWSGQLHEIGVAVSHSSYHKHGAYLVQYSDLPGFTTREQRTMGSLVLAQKGNLRKLGEALLDADFAKAVLAMRLAVLLMHARVEDASKGLRLRHRKQTIELEIAGQWLDEHPTLLVGFEKESDAWAEVGVDFQIRRL